MDSPQNVEYDEFDTYKGIIKKLQKVLHMPHDNDD